MNQRALKFRAWSPSKKLWRSDWSISEYTEILDLNETRMDDDLILCQFTGLKDKQGKDIYEGDILGGGFECAIFWCERCGGFQLAFEDNTCAACSGDVLWNEVVEDNRLEVIGNIYENK